MPVRYSSAHFPDYAYLPGQMPKDEKRSDIPQFRLQKLSSQNWQTNEAYLYGIDLFNHAFYYEAHEVWEELWHVTGHKTQEGIFLKALIQIAAVRLKISLQEEKPAQRSLLSAQKYLEEIHSLHSYFAGLDLTSFIKQLKEISSLVIRLQ